MSIILAIDPGISKCGVIVADLTEKKVYEAVVINSCLLLKYVKKNIKTKKIFNVSLVMEQAVKFI